MKKTLANSGYIGADKSLSSEGVITLSKTYNEVTSVDQNFLPHNLPPRELILTIDTSRTGGTSATQFRVNVQGSGNNFNVEWGDGQKDLNLTSDTTHTYASSGIYQVKITGLAYLYYYGDNDGDKIIEIKNFGFGFDFKSGLRAFRNSNSFDLTSKAAPVFKNNISLQEFFYNCTSLKGKTANWKWDLTNVTSVQSMFHTCTSFDADLSDFKIHLLNGGGASSLSSLFYNCQSFNNGGSLGILNWDTSNVTSMGSMFYNCNSFNQPIGNWNTSNVTSFYQMFYNANIFNQNLGNWDTSNVTSMYRFFRNAPLFNNGESDSIKNWDVSNVTSFRECFQQTDFNHPIESWDVSGVTGTIPFASMFYQTPFNHPLAAWSSSIRGSLSAMFFDCDNFDQDIGSWDMSSVTSLSQFMYASAQFNNANTGSISSWDMSSCTSFYRAFRNTGQFNQPIGSWTMNTSSNYSVQEMFRQCNFDQSLAGWNISRLSNGTNFLFGVTLSTSNYDATLVGWGAQSGSVISGVNIHFGNSEYTSGSLADQRRQDLIDAGWTITDGGYA